MIDNITILNNPAPGASVGVQGENGAKNITVNNFRAEDIWVPLYFTDATDILLTNLSLIRNAAGI